MKNLAIELIAGAIATTAALTLGAALSAPVPARAESVGITQAAPQLTAYGSLIQRQAEVLVNYLAQGEFDRARQNLHPVLQSEWTAANVQQYWQELQQHSGNFQARVGSTVDGNLVLVTLIFANRTQDLFVIFNQQGDIIGLDYPVE